MRKSEKEMAYLKQVGKRIVEAEIDAGKTQRATAKAIGKNGAALSNYERGKCSPSLMTIKRLAEVLDVSADWLLGVE